MLPSVRLHKSTGVYNRNFTVSMLHAASVSCKENSPTLDVQIGNCCTYFSFVCQNLGLQSDIPHNSCCQAMLDNISAIHDSRTHHPSHRGFYRATHQILCYSADMFPLE